MGIEIYYESFGVSVVGAHGKLIYVGHSTEVLLRGKHAYEVEGKHIQDAFPFLTDNEREFILTGITAEEWDELFGEEE